MLLLHREEALFATLKSYPHNQAQIERQRQHKQVSHCENAHKFGHFSETERKGSTWKQSTEETE